MPDASKFEKHVPAFLKAYPIGSTVTNAGLLDFAEQRADGFAVDLLADSDKKKVAAIRRHLNDGAASLNLPEQQRCKIVVEDSKREVNRVVSLSDYAQDLAQQAVSKSVNGAIAPLKKTQAALEAVKRDELDPEERQELEQNLDRIVEAYDASKLYHAQALRNDYKQKLIGRGMTSTAADHMLDVWITTSISQMRLLKSLS